MEIMSQLHVYFNSTLIRELRVDIENHMSLDEVTKFIILVVASENGGKMSQITILKEQI